MVQTNKKENQINKVIKNIKKIKNKIIKIIKNNKILNKK